jgi:hypothetical protein
MMLNFDGMDPAGQQRNLAVAIGHASLASSDTSAVST